MQDAGTARGTFAGTATDLERNSDTGSVVCTVDKGVSSSANLMLAKYYLALLGSHIAKTG